MSTHFKYYLPAFTLLMLVFACTPSPKDDSVVLTTIGEDKVPIIHVDKISDKSEVKLTDWVEDIRFIPLETNDQCMFDYIMRVYVGKEYILISTISKGILMFDQNGKFIRILASHGKGPGELMDANRNIFVDEKNDKLYVTDFSVMTDRMIVYDIKTGHYNNIPIMHEGPEIGIRDIIVRNDSIMYITTMQMRGGKSDCPLFCQTTTGKLLWEIKKTHPLGLTDASIHLAKDKIFMYYNFVQDTTWLVEGQQLKPVAIISTEMGRSYLEEIVGNGYLGMIPVNDHLFQGYMATVKSVEMDERSHRNRAQYTDRESFIFDTKTNRTSLIGQIKNDFLGSNEKFYTQFHHNGLVTMTYQALDLREIADSISKVPNIPKELKTRMDHILATVNENDNPVILVGRLKDL
jgi:hypothetical protein